MKTGGLRRLTPRVPGYDALPEARWTHQFDLGAVSAAYAAAGLDAAKAPVVADAEHLVTGQLRFYGGDHRLVGWPPRWHCFPDGSAGPPSDVHWSDISDDLAGDIKDLWEPSRFGFTFLLARAYLLTGDERWAEHWWGAVEDWTRSNPPNTGVNWRCGQESSLRGIALCFGLSAFGTAGCTTEERCALVGRLLTATVRRVRPTVAYALSQRNNHAISELVFLLTVAERPSRRYERLLREALKDQFSPDGSYSQLSLNYERLAVHALVWLLHAQPLMAIETRACVIEALTTAGEFLRRASDPVASRLPNSGANDGALLLDLDLADRWDAGPTLSLLGVLRDRVTEAECWLPPASIGVPGPAVASTTTAYPTLRGKRTLVFTHVGPASHRPGDDDQQSVEVIVDGRPVVLDAGSFRYSGRSPWRQPFTGADVHNGPRPEVGGDAVAIGRFLREATPAARLLAWSDETESGHLSSVRTFESVSAHRVIVRQGEAIAVADRVLGGDAVATWLLPAEARLDGNEVALDLASIRFEGFSSVTVARRSADDPASGWWSPRYGELAEATAVACGLRPGAVCVVRVTPAGAEPVDAAAVAKAFGDVAMGAAREFAVSEAVPA